MEIFVYFFYRFVGSQKNRFFISFTDGFAAIAHTLRLPLLGSADRRQGQCGCHRFQVRPADRTAFQPWDNQSIPNS